MRIIVGNQDDNQPYRAAGPNRSQRRRILAEIVDESRHGRQYPDR
jgi:hypothetical protein